MSGQTSDQQLVERVQRGDKNAFNLLVRKYQNKVRKCQKKVQWSASKWTGHGRRAFGLWAKVGLRIWRGPSRQIQRRLVDWPQRTD